MCARIIQTTDVHALGRIYQIETDNTIEAPHRWNGSPGTEYPLLRTRDGVRELAAMSWGFIPAYKDDTSFRLNNARSETVAVKPTFRDAFAHRRCVLPVNGWYEWRQRGGARSEPYVIDDGEGGILHLAGIWETWRGAGERVDAFAVLTTMPGPAVSAIHHRQPTVLTIDEVDGWLDTGTSLSELRRLATLGAKREYRIRRIGFEVNDVRNDGPELLAAAG